MNVENKKQLATILLAVGLGGIAVWLTSTYVEDQVVRQVDTLAREYAAQKSQLVDEIEDLNNRIKTAEQRQASLKRQIDQVKKQPPQQVVVKQRTASGKEVIVDTTVFSTVTPPGKRAITVLIDSLSAVGGLVNPGDFVDVIGELSVPHPTDPEGDPEDVISVLFQNVQVLAVGTNFKPVGNSVVYQEQHQTRQLSVTLAVDPEEAGLITFSQAKGKLKLTLRSPVELETQELQVASWDALSDYVMDRQGTELLVPAKKAKIRSSDDDTSDVETFIQIFKGGQEL